jgi:hypothetical protein
MEVTSTCIEGGCAVLVTRSYRGAVYGEVHYCSDSENVFKVIGIH